MKLDLFTREKNIFKQLSDPYKIQDYIDQLKINFEKQGDTCSSPRVVLKRQSAHCIEAALLGAAAMIFHGKKPYVLDLKANSNDFDHVVLLFKKHGKWGAISKSNHPTLRFRDPVYSTPRELAMSYFHEYINTKGEKTLRSYSRPHSLAKYGIQWITQPGDLWEIANELDEIPHFKILPKKLKLRQADRMEIRAGNLTEWPEKKSISFARRARKW